MSNIFYSHVDDNLRTELDLRGKSGFRRNNDDLNFMLGKIANVEITAYETGSSRANVSGRLGGTTTREGRFLPNSPDGFLRNSTYTTSSVVYQYNGDIVTGATVETSTKITDTTNRVGPFITSVDVSIGDHSMGLLNKATVNFIVPNPQRDLDTVEEVWFRPGRFVKIEMHHGNDAVISRQQTEGRLLPISLPNTASLKERYPEWNIDELLQQINRMNVFVFEGLITSFEFSYTDSGQVEASLSLTGTSNSYTDISMYMPPTPKEADPKESKPKVNPKTQTLDIPPAQGANPEAKSEFYDTLNSIMVNLVTKKDATQTQTLLLNFEIPGSSTSQFKDRFILVGEPYPPAVNDLAAKTEVVRIQNQIESGAVTGSITASMIERANYIAQAATDEANPVTHYNRYITLGGLIHMINYYIIEKGISIPNQQAFTKILCDDTQCFSNYLPYLTSCTPDQVLLLPEVSGVNGMNSYGDTIYYEKVAAESAAAGYSTWPGVYKKTTDSDGVIYPSRIFINIEEIKKILTSISADNTKKYTIDTFLTAISGKINYATAGAINMHLVSHPSSPSTLLFTDVKYIKPAQSTNPEVKTPGVIPVIPYSVPMMANHPNGTIVRSFRFSATLPESVKNLSYVLNQGDEITEQEIAPYMNFMYSTKDAKQINNFISGFKVKHETYLKELQETKNRLALSPTEPELIKSLYKSLNNYIKYPSPDLKKSQIMVAPIFPFTVEFEIDGINGFRYGDVLTFDMLPLKYKINTVFSIIGITHTVSTEGQWTTNIRCIMRPKID